MPCRAAAHLGKEGEQKHAATFQMSGLDLQKVGRLKRGEDPDLQAKGVGSSLHRNKTQGKTTRPDQRAVKSPGIQKCITRGNICSLPTAVCNVCAT